MVVAGANRHAKEILQILRKTKTTILLFDDHSTELDGYFDEFIWIKDINDRRLKKEKVFVLALGGTNSRLIVSKKLIKVGLKPQSVVANTAVVGTHQVEVGKGVNLMHFAFVADSASIGEGTLVNAYAAIHHDAEIGDYCEISPRVSVLGGARVGNLTSVGAGAVILPNIDIGENCQIGAGAVINRNIPDNCVVVGVPGKVIKRN